MANYELDDKVAVITGGAGGIGTEIAKEYASAGAKVVVVGRNSQSLEVVVSAIQSEGGEAMAVSTDITKPEDVKNLISKTVSYFGRIDILVNNAGNGSSIKKAEDTPYEEWVRLIDLNLTGTFNCCMAAGKQMIEQQSGNIINISSTAGTKGNPGMLHYSAAKAGMISLSNNLAYMWAEHNINVNCIAPGLIATPIMKSYPGAIPAEVSEDGTPVPPLTRTPGPEDVAAMARFLASPAAKMITGELLPVRAWFKSDRFWE
jgi:3-oxoacyl-[acyl-carrier protein] reductase